MKIVHYIRKTMIERSIFLDVSFRTCLFLFYFPSSTKVIVILLFCVLFHVEPLPNLSTIDHSRLQFFVTVRHEKLGSLTALFMLGLIHAKRSGSRVIAQGLKSRSWSNRITKGLQSKFDSWLDFLKLRLLVTVVRFASSKFYPRGLVSVS